MTFPNTFVSLDTFAYADGPLAGPWADDTAVAGSGLIVSGNAATATLDFNDSVSYWKIPLATSTFAYMTLGVLPALTNGKGAFVQFVNRVNPSIYSLLLRVSRGASNWTMLIFSAGGANAGFTVTPVAGDSFGIGVDMNTLRASGYQRPKNSNLWTRRITNLDLTIGGTDPVTFANGMQGWNAELSTNDVTCRITEFGAGDLPDAVAPHTAGAGTSW